MATDTTYAAALQTATAFPDNSIDPRDKYVQPIESAF